MSNHTVRNTKKSRLVAEFSEAIIDMYSSEVSAISKGAIVDAVLDNSIGPDASTAIRTMLEDELANELERYFIDSVKDAAQAIDRPYHLITKKYFKLKKFPDSKYEAQRCVCTFGNGRTGPAAGVRFVPEGVTDDPFLLLQLEKKIDCSNKSIKTQNKQVEHALQSGAVTAIEAEGMTKRLPHAG